MDAVCPVPCTLWPIWLIYIWSKYLPLHILYIFVHFIMRIWEYVFFERICFLNCLAPIFIHMGKSIYLMPNRWCRWMWMISANTDNRQVLIRDNFHGEWRVRGNLRPGFTQKTLETVMTGQILSVCINYLETDGRMKLCISCQCKYYCDDRVSAGTG